MEVSHQMKRTGCTLAWLKERGRAILAHARNITSQSGEDGILLYALSRLPVRDYWCVEFGAWDGKYLSNTFNLVATQNYRAILIESDNQKFEQLELRYEYLNSIIPIHALVGFSSHDCLDVLIKRHPIPVQFDLLSVDIDGNDYHAWSAIEQYKPKLVIIEYNPTVANSVHFVQAMDASCSQGSSAAALVKLANTKGYQLIAVTPLNLLFVVDEHFELFEIPDNALEILRDDSMCPQVFITYDGLIHLVHHGVSGLVVLPWHGGLTLKEEDVQCLPSNLRAYPPNYTKMQLDQFEKFRRERSAITVYRTDKT
jgi:hypothetical protein